ncbi:MAG TPA: hypothetical protein VFN26_19485 [Candidatus Acidoferrum sp.]|nr:hypothetical protein [Candidatus Acidoferrum sp.]
MRWGISVLIVAASFFTFSCRRENQKDTPDDINTYMASLSARAVERARSGYGVTLDYSPESIKEVEKLLAMKYELQKTHPMLENETADAAHLWGAYIGEVMKRLRPAHWERDSAAGGKDSLPVVFSDTHEESYPCAWVYHRLKNGEEDNVWTKFYFVTQPGGLKQYFPEKKN